MEDWSRLVVASLVNSFSVFMAETVSRQRAAPDIEHQIFDIFSFREADKQKTSNENISEMFQPAEENISISQRRHLTRFRGVLRPSPAARWC